MRTITTTLYQFSELSTVAQARAIADSQAAYEFYPDTDWHKDDLIAAGFIEPTIHYTGFGSQGDGACFDATIDKERFLIGKYEVLKDVDFELKIRTINHSYYHEKTRDVEAVIYDATDEEEALISYLEADIERLRLDMCHKIYTDLQADYDYQLGAESIADHLELNGFEFTEDGKAV